jgi:hypothetical protein
MNCQVPERVLLWIDELSINPRSAGVHCLIDLLEFLIDFVFSMPVEPASADSANSASACPFPVENVILFFRQGAPRLARSRPGLTEVIGLAISFRARLEGGIGPPARAGRSRCQVVLGEDVVATQVRFAGIRRG